tara:strand:+ start:700 stop:1434 length:735 start_codon:yes stop_codon:yes gene_type:complete
MRTAQGVYYGEQRPDNLVGKLYFDNDTLYDKEWLIKDASMPGGQAWLNSAQLDARFGANHQYIGLGDGHIYGQKFQGRDYTGMSSTYAEQKNLGIAADLPANRQPIYGLEIDYPEGYGATFFEKMGIDPNNMTDLQSAQVSSTIRTKPGFADFLDDTGYGDTVRTAAQGFEARGGTLPDHLLPYGVEANTDTMVIPNRTGATSSATAQSEAARVDTNRQTRKNKGSSSYGGGRTSVRTSNAINT